MGSQWRRIYGLPKIHTLNVPLRQIISMCGSVQNELAKWLVKLLVSVLQFYSGCCISGSFLFASMICQLPRCVVTEFLVSLDISSLFHNIPLDKIIGICADYLYRSHLKSPQFPGHIFIKLMELATKSVSFSFYDTVYREVDSILMGRPLGPLLCNVFVGFLEQQLFDKVYKPYCYVRYADHSSNYH